MQILSPALFCPMKGHYPDKEVNEHLIIFSSAQTQPASVSTMTDLHELGEAHLLELNILATLTELLRNLWNQD